jgi:hypothetical protein
VLGFRCMGNADRSVLTHGALPLMLWRRDSRGRLAARGYRFNRVRQEDGLIASVRVTSCTVESQLRLGIPIDTAHLDAFGLASRCWLARKEGPCP